MDMEMGLAGPVLPKGKRNGLGKEIKKKID